MLQTLKALSQASRPSMALLQSLLSGDAGAQDNHMMPTNLTPEDLLSLQAIGAVAPNASVAPAQREIASAPQAAVRMPASGNPSSQNEAMAQMVRDSILAQQADIQAQREKALTLRGLDESSDLSPLFALADQWTGGNLSKGYKRPTTMDDALAQLRDYGNTAIAQQKALTNDTQQMYAKQEDLRQKDLDRQMDREKLQMLKDVADKKNSAKKLPPTIILKLNEGNSIPALLDNIEKTIGVNKDKFGYGFALASTPLGRFTNPEAYEQAQTINAQLAAAKQAVGKFLEGGVLRKEDELKYKEMLAGISDVPEVAVNKLKIMMNQIRQSQKMALAAFEAQGYDTRGLELPGKDSALPDVLTGANQGPKESHTADSLKNLSVEELQKLLE